MIIFIASGDERLIYSTQRRRKRGTGWAKTLPRNALDSLAAAQLLV